MQREVEILAAYLAKRSAIRGKKAFQKLAYFAKVLGYPLRADFRMHLFGPYSEQLAAELDQANTRGIVEAGDAGTSMHAGPLADRVMVENDQVLEEHSASLNLLWDLFGDKSPRQLELLATAHFIGEVLRKHYGIVERSKVIKAIADAKAPKFSIEEIEEAFDRVTERGRLDARCAADPD